MKIAIDNSFIEKHFSIDQIKRIMDKHNMTYEETVFYLMFFNYVSITQEDLDNDMGKSMYEKFAKCIGKFMEKE